MWDWPVCYISKTLEPLHNKPVFLIAIIQLLVHASACTDTDFALMK